MTAYQNDQAIAPTPVKETSIELDGLKAGLTTCASFIVYFGVMKYFQVMDSAIAWGFNFIILFTGIILAYRGYRLKTKLNMDYIPGLILGVITTAASVTPFVVFLYFYFSNVNPAVLMILKDNILFMGEEITPVRAAASTMVEGICSGVIISFIMMQYFRSGFSRSKKEILVHG